MLTKADKGGGGVKQLLTIAEEGGRGVWKPPKLADIICGQPLTAYHNEKSSCRSWQQFWQVSCGGTNLSLSQPTAPDLGEARLQVTSHWCRRPADLLGRVWKKLLSFCQPDRHRDDDKDDHHHYWWGFWLNAASNTLIVFQFRWWT